MFEKIKDIVFGTPIIQAPKPRMNRKQKRHQQKMLRKRAAAANRKKHEGR
ncbi:hypothetical protein MNBD_GAMMA15-1659 [hydrothermal vent metagenome]|uniref:Uncharacterized protein n=1 Tax=hydrothermal vent metagenome TaxID=652676 RepID=A0A3B0YWB6_9ZZZZ